jgi:hypothetical protein
MDDLSFLTINTLISIAIPGIANTILSVLLNIIQFDVLFTEKWLPESLSKVGFTFLNEKDESLSSIFDENGYSSQFFIVNLGSGIIFLALYTLTILTLFVSAPISLYLPFLKKLR